jgi:hypothetical protein
MQLGGCAGDASVGRDAQCVRACKFGEQFGELASDVRSVRAAEIVRTRKKCVTAPAPQATTARPRPARPAHPSTSHRPAKSDLTEHQSGASGTPRLSRPCKLLRLSGLAITMHNVRHMEWGFYSEKPAIGAGGMRPGYTTATATHKPPQTFFRQLAPFAVDATRRHATFPYVRQDIPACVSLLHRGAH